MTGTDPVRVLAGIWTELLGRDGIGLDEDFFQIGGDSILSVGVAARAARSGVPITPQDVLRNPTLRGLAAVVPSTGGARPVIESSGPVLPTPLVEQLLDEADDPSDFVVVEVLSVAAGVRADAVRAAVDRLTAIQEPLRYRFRRNALGWRIERAEEAGHLFDSVVLPLVVHHFAYDEVSAVPLLEDLNAALAGGATEVRPAGRAPGAAPGSGGEPGVVHRRVRVDDLADVLTRPGAPGREAVLAAVACAWPRRRGEPNAFLSTVVADALRAVPNDGVGYGVLRHLSPDTDAVTRLRSLPEPELLVEHKVGGGPVQISGAPIAGTNTALPAAVPIMHASASMRVQALSRRSAPASSGPSPRESSARQRKAPSGHPGS